MATNIDAIDLVGIEGKVAKITIDERAAATGMDIAGLASPGAKEARYRVRSAIRASGLRWPESRLVVAFAPADRHRRGCAYDLPVAVGVMGATNVIPDGATDGAVFFGELALDGKIRACRGALNAALAAKEAGYRRFHTGIANAEEAANIPGIEVIAHADLGSVADALSGRLPAVPVAPLAVRSARSPVDMRSIRGLDKAKRALEIAATGGHSVLFVGPAGCGKTLLARAFTGIMPETIDSERLETSLVHSVRGLLRDGAMPSERPFRAPHASASTVALVGGGSTLAPGEVSLAHNGVLFLDEIPEFSRHALESVARAYRDRSVTITRNGETCTMPANFALIGAMNPCPCGYPGDLGGAWSCRCTPDAIERYRARLAPIIGCFDMVVEIDAVDARTIATEPTGDTSDWIRARVVANSAERGSVTFNCDGWDMLCDAFERRSLSGAGWTRALRVAKTLAAMDGVSRVEERHVIEAVGYQHAG